MMKDKHSLRWHLRIWAIVGCWLLFLCADAHSGPLPPPMEVELDLARHVVVGRIVEIDREFDPKGSLQLAAATIEVSRTLKGPDKKTVNAQVVIGIGSAGWGGSWAPKIRKKGDSGIWILGNASGTFGLVPESKLREVEQALQFLSNRTWTDPTDGLVAWAGVLYPQYERNPRPWLALAIRNVSDREVHYPLDGISGTAMAEGERALQMVSRVNRRGRVFCRKILPGETVYVVNYFFVFHFKNAPPDKYTVMLTYENSQDDVRSVGPAKRTTVEAWKGKLAPIPIEVSTATEKGPDAQQTPERDK